jgi:hypothetical protein
MDLPETSDTLFVRDVRWRALDETAVAAFYCGQKELGRKALALLTNPIEIPEYARARLVANAKHYAN